MVGIVYTITHRETGREYIGMTGRPLRERWKNHVHDAQFARKRNKITNALRKYGADAFDWRVYAVLPTRQEALIAERIAIALFKPVFNLTAGGEGLSGFKPVWTGGKRGPYKPKGPEWVPKHHSVEGKANISKGLRGRKLSPEHVAKCRAFHLTRKCSPETIAKMRVSAQARVARQRADKAAAHG